MPSPRTVLPNMALPTVPKVNVGDRLVVVTVTFAGERRIGRLPAPKN